MLNVSMLSVTLVSVVMLNVDMLSALAPFYAMFESINVFWPNDFGPKVVVPIL